MLNHRDQGKPSDVEHVMIRVAKIQAVLAGVVNSACLFNLPEPYARQTLEEASQGIDELLHFLGHKGVVEQAEARGADAVYEQVKQEARADAETLAKAYPHGVGSNGRQ